MVEDVTKGTTVVGAVAGMLVGAVGEGMGLQLNPQSGRCNGVSRGRGDRV